MQRLIRQIFDVVLDRVDGLMIRLAAVFNERVESEAEDAGGSVQTSAAIAKHIGKMREGNVWLDENLLRRAQVLLT